MALGLNANSLRSWYRNLHSNNRGNAAFVLERGPLVVVRDRRTGLTNQLGVTRPYRGVAYCPFQGAELNRHCEDYRSMSPNERADSAGRVHGRLQCRDAEGRSVERPRRGYPLFVPALVDSNPAGLDDPQAAFNRVSRQSTKQATDHGAQQIGARIPRNADNCNPSRNVRWKTDHIGEIKIQRNQTAALPRAEREKIAIRATLKALVTNRLDVVAQLAENTCGPAAEVLVEFESHAAVGVGISTNRSRDISAP